MGNMTERMLLDLKSELKDIQTCVNYETAQADKKGSFNSQKLLIMAIAAEQQIGALFESLQSNRAPETEELVDEMKSTALDIKDDTYILKKLAFKEIADKHRKNM